MSLSSLTPHIQLAEPLAQLTVAAAAISATYSLVGNLSKGGCYIVITSTLDENVQLSFDGSSDHLPILKNSQLTLELKTNALVMKGGMPIYVKEIGNPTTGSLYISIFSV